MGEIFESVKRGMEEAIVHSRGDKSEVRLFVLEEANVKQVHEQDQKQPDKTGCVKHTCFSDPWSSVCILPLSVIIDEHHTGVATKKYLAEGTNHED